MINNHVNKIILVGQVETPKLPTRLNSKQSLVTNFELKTQLQIRTGNGFVVEETCLHSITAWGDLARLCIKNLHEGSLIYLEGRLCWGNGSERRKFGESGNKPWIVAEQIRLLNMIGEGEGESEVERENETNSASEEDSDEEDPEDGFLFSSHPLTTSKHTRRNPVRLP